MKYMLDLFSGLGGASQAFRESRDWGVVTVDSNPKFEPTICVDILYLTPEDFRDYDFDFVWASPPCNSFSMASAWVRGYWSKEYLPTRPETVESVKLVYHTLYLIANLNPEWWVLENPRGMLRKCMPLEPTVTVDYCRYGSTWKKPTDLWGKIPESFTPLRCNHDGHKKMGKQSTIRDKTRDSSQRAEIPYGLSKAILKAIENPEPIGLSKYIEKRTEP